MEFRLIEAGSPEHEAELDLRYRLLRKPHGMPRGSERYTAEEDCLHLVALEADQVIGCVLFHAKDDRSGRLLQMVVEEAAQGRGVGRALVRRLEAQLVKDGISEVVLHARDHAIGFYEKLGYHTFGEPYLEVGIPHESMRRALEVAPTAES